jgi:RNA polymerase sigma-B factor
MTAASTLAGQPGRAGVLPPRPAGGATVQDLLQQRTDLPAGHPGHAALRERCIEAGLPLARCLAARYIGRGEPLDDLYQVAALALVNAVDRYQPARQTAFTTYAVPTIVGALKRHFRDTTWRVKVPREIQELAVNVARADGRLAQQLGRSPTPRELAAYLHASDQDVAVALRIWSARRPDSLDTPSANGEQGPRPRIDAVGAIDTRFDTIADRHVLQTLMAALPVRQQRILALRYVSDMTQAEIAADVGVSQMQISRLLARALSKLRTGLLAQGT